MFLMNWPVKANMWSLEVLRKLLPQKKSSPFVENYVLFRAIKGYYSLKVKFKKYL